MKLYVETNVKHGKGYQVRAVWDNVETDVIDFGPYTLKKAVLMAEKALDIFNRDHGTEYRLDDVLEIDKASVSENREYDSLSEKMSGGGDME